MQLKSLLLCAAVVSFGFFSGCIKSTEVMVKEIVQGQEEIFSGLAQKAAVKARWSTKAESCEAGEIILEKQSETCYGFEQDFSVATRGTITGESVFYFSVVVSGKVKKSEGEWMVSRKSLSAKAELLSGP